METTQKDEHNYKYSIKKDVQACPIDFEIRNVKWCEKSERILVGGNQPQKGPCISVHDPGKNKYSQTKQVMNKNEQTNQISSLAWTTTNEICVSTKICDNDTLGHIHLFDFRSSIKTAWKFPNQCYNGVQVDPFNENYIAAFSKPDIHRTGKYFIELGKYTVTVSLILLTLILINLKMTSELQKNKVKTRRPKI